MYLNLLMLLDKGGESEQAPTSGEKRKLIGDLEEQLKEIESEAGSLQSRRNECLTQLQKLKPTPPDETTKKLVKLCKKVSGALGDAVCTGDLTPIKEVNSVAKNQEFERVQVDWNNFDAEPGGFVEYESEIANQNFKSADEPLGGGIKVDRKEPGKAEEIKISEEDIEKWSVERLKEEMKRFGMKMGTKVK